MNTKLITRYAIREVIGLVVMGAALFLAAGRVDWWGAWALLGVMLLWSIATAVVILKYNPSLLAERLGPRKGAEKWDTAIMSLLGLLQLARYIVAGLDVRGGWSAGFSVGAAVPALIAGALGYALVTWATASNAYFSQIVRIQSERGQVVVTGGPYRFLRHPAYLGALGFELAAPLVLGSAWAVIPSLLTAGLILLRTGLEDRLLKERLAGYRAYAAKVRYRLLPGVW